MKNVLKMKLVWILQCLNIHIILGQKYLANRSFLFITENQVVGCVDQQCIIQYDNGKC